jgi:branched-chain amino acid transport system permease protein
MSKKTGIKNSYLIGIGLIIIFALFLSPWILPEYMTIVLTRMVILSILAMSLDILFGYAGIGAIGHVAFFAIGGYTTALMVTRLHASLEATLVVSIFLSAAACAVAGLLILRAVRTYLLMISLAICMCVWGLLFRWVSLTGGETGITLMRPNSGMLWDITETNGYYYFVLIIFFISLILMLGLVHSPFGKSLIGIRDSESRMKVLGYNVWLHKYLALIISGAFAGLAGNLYVCFNKFISPEYSGLAMAFDFVLMVIIGGPGTLLGPILGAFIVVLLKEVLSLYFSRWLLVLGIAYILTAFYARQGIVGLWRDFYARRKLRGTSGPAHFEGVKNVGSP